MAHREKIVNSFASFPVSFPTCSWYFGTV